MILKEVISRYLNEITPAKRGCECETQRNKLAKKYQEYSKNNDLFNCSFQEQGLCSHYKQIVKTRVNNNILRNYFNKYNIALKDEVWKYPIHMQPFYKYKFKDKKFPYAKYFSKFHICPPLYPELKFKELDYILSIFDKATSELKNKFKKL